MRFAVSSYLNFGFKPFACVIRSLAAPREFFTRELRDCECILWTDDHDIFFWPNLKHIPGLAIFGRTANLETLTLSYRISEGSIVLAKFCSTAINN
jgi:hypothetical protein